MKIQRTIAICLVVLMTLPLCADNQEYIHGRHAIRVGWGMSTNRIMHLYLDVFDIIPPGIPISTLDLIQGMSASEAHDFLMNYRSAQHKYYSNIGNIFVSYNYRLTPLLSVGAEVNFSQATDHRRLYNGYKTLVEKNDKLHLSHLSIVPSLRATYYRHPVVELYSALGVGYTWSCLGTNEHAHGITFNTTLLGVNVGNEHWFAEAEVGGLSTLTFFWYGGYEYFYDSRLCSIAVGYRF